VPFIGPSSPSAAEVGSGLCWNFAVTEKFAAPIIVMSQLYFLLVELPGTREEEGLSHSLIIRNRTTLVAQERWNIKEAKNVGAGDIWW
jgi:hypothetical protein